MKIGKYRKYTPYLALAGATIVLLLIIIVVTVQRAQREKEWAKKALTREGSLLIRAFEASVRTWLTSDNWRPEQIQQLAEEAVQEPEIKFITVMSESGYALVQSGEVPPNISFTPMFGSGNEGGLATYQTISSAFVVAKRFRPLPISAPHHIQQRWSNWCGWENTTTTSDPCCAPNTAVSEVSWSTSEFTPTIAVGLDRAPYDEARAEDLRQAVILGGILFGAGAASLLLVITLQNYRTTKTALGEVTSYSDNVVRSIGEGLISVDTDGNIQRFNQAAVDILGLQRDQMVGQHYRTVLNPDQCNLDRIIRDGGPMVDQIINCSVSGSSIPLRLSATRVKADDGRVLGAVAVFHDLRHVQQLEEKLRQSERLASLGQMSAVVAHEIRNPLSSIKGFARYLEGRFDDGTDEKHFAQTIEQEAERLNHVVTDLLDFSKPIALNLADVDLGSVITDVERLTANDLKSARIELVKHIPEKPIVCSGDRNLLVQVILNLVLNALDAIGENGRIDITVSKDTNELVLEIKDSGPGIPEDQQKQLFEPFFTTKQNGSGLGLAIARKIMTEHGGRIEVASGPGEGTAFHICLPVQSLS